jgi:hypothetical protein
MFFQSISNNTKSLTVLALLLLIFPCYAISEQSTKSIYEKNDYDSWEKETYYDNKSTDYNDNKPDSEYKPYHDKSWSDHDREKSWSDYVKKARVYFRKSLREFFQYLRRIRDALKDPNTDWDDFDWSWESDEDDSTGDDTADDDSTGDDTAEDDSTGDDTLDDDSNNDDIADDDSAGDDTAEDDSTGDDTTDDDTLDDNSTGDNPLMQSVSVSNQPVGFLGENVVLDLAYSTSNDNNQLSGLGVRVHFDSSVLTFNSVSEVIQQDIIVSGEGPASDDEDFDNNPQTDSYISFGWASLFNNWPNTILPASLAKMTFGVSSAINLESSGITQINFTSITTTAGYQFDSESYALELKETDASWDFDGNGDADALTDGLIMMRYSFGLRGQTMANGIISNDSLMSAAQIEERMSYSMKIADIDDDGKVDALTDGLLLIRHLFAIDDESFSTGVVGHSASRKTKHALKHHLNKYMPKKIKTSR